MPTKNETELANSLEFQLAAQRLGAAEVVEPGFVTDVLGDVSMVALRKRIVLNFRKYKPYAVMTFDPYAIYCPASQFNRTIIHLVDSVSNEVMAAIEELPITSGVVLKAKLNNAPQSISLANGAELAGQYMDGWLSAQIPPYHTHCVVVIS